MDQSVYAEPMKTIQHAATSLKLFLEMVVAPARFVLFVSVEFPFICFL